MNTFPRFFAPIEVDGFGFYSIHHIHKKSTQSNAIPLLFLHGGPGSFLEVTRILDDLTEGPPDVPAFHVVAPSLVDFGFSSASGKVSNVFWPIPRHRF
jgi:pimeloyl-ACP methyl ester carboxylesterase